MTVLDVIQRGSEFLSRRGVDSPRLQMELMLAQVLGLPRLKLYIQFDRQLSETEANLLRERVRRRGEREPLQHILGTVDFCGFELAVDRRVLVPRPETELLAEKAWQHLEKREGPTALKVVDVGAGSGCVAIALAKKVEKAEVHAVDLSEGALEVARLNAMRHQARMTFHLSDHLRDVPEPGRFDLIVSNPPYIPTGELAGLQPEVRDYDPPEALDGGPDGLDHYRRLAAESPDRLLPGGRLMLELGHGQARAVEGILRGHGWRIESIDPDYARIERILVAAREKD